MEWSRRQESQTGETGTLDKKERRRQSSDNARLLTIEGGNTSQKQNYPEKDQLCPSYIPLSKLRSYTSVAYKRLQTN